MNGRNHAFARVRLVVAGGVHLLLVLGITSPAPAQPPGPRQEQVRFLLHAPLPMLDAAVGAGQIAGFERSNPVYSDERVDRIAARLRQACPRKDLRVRVVRDDSINAFAMMGGAIYINSGLLEAVGADDDALAAVIAHEMGHAARYHSAAAFRRQVEQELRPRPRSAGESIGEQIGIAIVKGSTSRDHEREADNDSARLMVSSGFDPEGLFRMFDILAQLPRDRTLKWFRSHPPPRDRTRRMRSFMEKRLGVKVPGGGPETSERPQKVVEVRVTVEPAELRLAAGKDAAVRYRFKYGKEPMKLLTRSAYFEAPGGTRLSDLIGPYETRFEMPGTGSFRWEDRPLLPVDVAEKARSMDVRTVLLRQSFHGELSDGSSATWTATLRIRIK